MNIILASQSPRRKELLERMGISPFKTISPNIDEHVFDDLPPEQMVRALSSEKASAIISHVGPNDIVIAADTVVALDGAVLGKPLDDLDAFKMLSALSGMRHQVYTGVTVCRGEERVTEHEVTDVFFRELSESEIECYVKTGEPLDKAGAYGVQGYGALLVERIIGDHYNVMGLPVCRLGQILTRFGVDCMRLAARID
ncbi:putative septum formation protein [uncultured Eubacteriales bacterium]|uniref:dTTP/UTP pyrophosphatase n=1 Tax=uncultured Eubacteriales bacterium TaxID=172733 RepID=A0A212KHZ4_9FIRM|nr:putative septum formation protein [uncultured Eubacteriales bacterium]